MATSTQNPFVTRNEMGNNANLGNALQITDKSSGAIGTAAATVDLYSIFLINQTTGSQTLTLPEPTDTTAGKIAIVLNVGSQAFTMLSTSITAGAGTIAVWNGTAWQRVVL